MENEIVNNEEVIVDVDTTIEAPVVEEVVAEEVVSEAPCCEA